MIDLIRLLALVGVTLIVARGTIFHPLQRLVPALFACSQCVGMWIGAAAGAYGIVGLGHGRLLDAVLVGGVTSLLAICIDAVLLRLLGDPSAHPSDNAGKGSDDSCAES